MTSSGVRPFSAYGPRMGLDDLFFPSGSFVARVSTSVTIVDRRPGRREILPIVNTVSRRFFPCFPMAAKTLQKPSLPRQLLPNMVLSPRALYRETIPPRSSIRLCLPFRRQATRPLLFFFRARTASPPGRTDEQLLQLALHRVLLVMASVPVGPLEHPPGVL